MSMFRTLLMCLKDSSHKEYIAFQDKEIERICIEKFSSDNIGVTYADVARVKSLGNAFRENTLITSFPELQYFTDVNLDISGAVAWKGQFFQCTHLNKIEIPKKVTIIGDNTFNGCPIELSKLPGSVMSIGAGAFAHTRLDGLDIVLPNITAIGSKAFLDSNIRRVSSLGMIESLGHATSGQTSSNGVFNGCSNLEYAKIPATVTFIEVGAFYKCSNLKVFICLAETPPTMGYGAFDECPLLSIYVPDTSVDAYKIAARWSPYASKIKPLSEYIEI